MAFLGLEPPQGNTSLNIYLILVHLLSQSFRPGKIPSWPSSLQTKRSFLELTLPGDGQGHVKGQAPAPSPSYQDLHQHKRVLLAACGRTHAGLKYSIHVIKSDQMQIFLLTSYTYASLFTASLTHSFI